MHGGEILTAPIATAGVSFQGVDEPRIAGSRKSPMKTSKSRGRQVASWRPSNTSFRVAVAVEGCLCVQNDVAHGAEANSCVPIAQSELDSPEPQVDVSAPHGIPSRPALFPEIASTAFGAPDVQSWCVDLNPRGQRTGDVRAQRSPALTRAR